MHVFSIFIIYFFAFNNVCILKSKSASSQIQYNNTKKHRRRVRKSRLFFILAIAKSVAVLIIILCSPDYAFIHTYYHPPNRDCIHRCDFVQFDFYFLVSCIHKYVHTFILTS